jgi:hypothetical protein
MRLRVGGLLIAGWAVLTLALLVSAGTVAAQEVGDEKPEKGPAGTHVTISGNLIGCYGGPGEITPYWGYPDRVVYYWNPQVSTPSQADAFEERLNKDPNNHDDLTEVGSYTFGPHPSGAWSISFAVPDGPHGPHENVISFEPRCQNRTGPNSNPVVLDINANNVPVSFCLTDDTGACALPAAAPPSTSPPTSPPTSLAGARPAGTGSQTPTSTTPSTTRRTAGVVLLAGGAALAAGAGVATLSHRSASSPGTARPDDPISSLQRPGTTVISAGQLRTLAGGFVDPSGNLRLPANAPRALAPLNGLPAPVPHIANGTVSVSLGALGRVDVQLGALNGQLHASAATSGPLSFEIDGGDVATAVQSQLNRINASIAQAHLQVTQVVTDHGAIRIVTGPR